MARKRLNPKRRAQKAQKALRDSMIRAGIAVNVATQEGAKEYSRLHSADQYRMVCGERTLMFTGRLPQSMGTPHKDWQR